MSAPPLPDHAQAWSVRWLLLTGVLALLVLLGGFGGWAMTSQLAGAIVAAGRIEVERNRQAIQHPEGGVVADLLIREGDRVEAGDVILRLAPGQLTRDKAVTAAQLFELRVRRARLEAERDGASSVSFSPALIQTSAGDAELADLMKGQETLFAARRDNGEREIEQLRGRVTQIEAQINALFAQDSALAQQLALVEADLERKNSLLERGLIQSDPVIRLQLVAAQLHGSIGELKAQNAEAAERVIETELAILQRRSTRREGAISELREVRVAEEELRQKLADLDRRMAGLDLRSPLAGRIIGLEVFGPQAVLRAGDPVAFLVPEGRPLVIMTEVPAIHIDQVFVGQEVSLRFPALDLRNLPDLMGTVTQVSADAFIDQRTGASNYRAEVALVAGELERLAPRELLPGMPVEAYIRTNDRTPMTYLLEPFTIYFTRAFRES